MSLLNQVQTGKILKPLALMIHAPHGIGKSTLGSEAPNPIFIGSEENDELDVARFPKVKSWIELESQLKALRDENHDYKTLVIDTIDALEQVAEQSILTGQNADKTMATAHGGFAKAYIKMANMFLNLRDNYLIPLRDKKKMNIVILAHSKKVKHEDPMTNTSYDHYETACDKRIKPIFEDWVSGIFFMNYYLVKAEGVDGKEYAEGLDGLRMLYTEERPSHVAKNRFNLPYEIECKKSGTFNEIANMVKKHYADAKKKAPEVSAQVDELRKAIAEKLPKADESVQDSIKMAVKKVGNDEKELTRINDKLAKLIA